MRKYFILNILRHLNGDLLSMKEDLPLDRSGQI